MSSKSAPLEGSRVIVGVAGRAMGRALSIGLRRNRARVVEIASPHLRQRCGFSIVNTSSDAALAGALSQKAFSASKAAINSLTQNIATQQRGSEGIRDTCAASGVGDLMLRHQLSPRFGTPEHIAAAVVFLSADESESIPGQILCVDGGALAHQPCVADFRTAAALA